MEERIIEVLDTGKASEGVGAPTLIRFSTTLLEHGYLVDNWTTVCKIKDGVLCYRVNQHYAILTDGETLNCIGGARSSLMDDDALDDEGQAFEHALVTADLSKVEIAHIAPGHGPLDCLSYVPGILLAAIGVYVKLRDNKGNW